MAEGIVHLFCHHRCLSLGFVFPLFHSRFSGGKRRFGHTLGT
jgi:hypothetical protein